MIDFIELGGTVSGFGIQNGEINCLSGNDLVKIVEGAVALQKTVFEKSGAARFFAENETHIVIADFCTLLSFSKETFEQESRKRDHAADVSELRQDRRSAPERRRR